MRYSLMAIAAALTLVGGWGLAEPAHASDWVVVGQGTDKSTTLIDAASARVAGSSVHFFSKTIYSAHAAPKHKKTARRKQTPTTSTVREETADCQQRTLTLIQWVDYGKDGQVLSSGEDVYPRPSAVIPDSIGEAELNFVCGGTQN